MLVMNPETGLSSFGKLDEMRSGSIIFPAGDIYLKTGEHSGPHRGFGVAHILAEHGNEIEPKSSAPEVDVARFVLSIIRPGSPVYFEQARLRGARRVSIVRSANGTAILEFQGTRGNAHYSVITAFRNAKAHGTKIGIVR
jgi:hypothetical protein